MPGNTNSCGSKNELRQVVRRLMRDAGPADGTPVREAVAAWLRARPELRTVACYAALPGEVDLLPLCAAFPGLRWLLPRVAGDDLVWHEIRNVERDLTPGAFGISEPCPGLPQVEPAAVDLWLCPGLAFDAHGGRLGKGRGYYDRTLAAARPDAVKIGVCFPHQRVEDVLAEPHDIPMNLVIDRPILLT